MNKILILVTFLLFAASAYSQTQAEQLKQMTAQLQSTPSDNALREKIIKLAATIKPAPAIPEEANRSYVKGRTFVEETKDANAAAAGYDLAVAAFREAVRIAPWWGDAYFNLGVTLGLAGKFDEAIASLKLSMASVPADSKEARDTQNRIYAIEAKAEMASKQAKTDAAEKATKDEDAASAKAAAKPTGPNFSGNWEWVESKGYVFISIEKDGDGWIIRDHPGNPNGEILSVVKEKGRQLWANGRYIKYHFILSEDAHTLELVVTELCGVAHDKPCDSMMTLKRK